MLAKKRYLSGGYEFNFRMVDHLLKAGIDVDVVHFDTVPGGLPGRWLAASIHVLKRIRAARPDMIIVSKSYQYVPLLRLAFAFLGCPIVYLMHHMEWMDESIRPRAFLYRQYVRWLLGMASAIWTNSRSSLSEITELGISRDKLVMINPGFEKVKDVPSHRSHREGPVGILCVGSMSPRKSQHLLIEACALLDSDFFSIEFAGSTDVDEEYADSVFKLIEKEHLWDSVSISGSLSNEELAAAYRRADLLVHPAAWEAFGISILEGMWHGLPVIASNVAAIPELVRNEENGLLVTPGNAKELGNAILYLVQHRDLRLQMGRKSREFASGMNDWNDSCREFLTMLYSVAKESGS